MTRRHRTEQADRTPLYQQVKQALRDSIDRGEYTPGAPFITERKVCQGFGVSTTTAVKALNELVADGVLVRRQGRGTFVADQEAPEGPSTNDPSVVAAGVAGHTITCILQQSHGVVGPLLGGIEATCAQFGYRMFLTLCNDDPEQEARALRKALDTGVSGIVLYPAEGAENVHLFTEARDRGVPLVLVDRYRPDVPTDAVVVDNLAVGYDVTDHLIKLGHRRIATLWDETDCTSVRDRHAGHLQALRAHGIPVDPELTVLRRYGEPGPGRRGDAASLLHVSDPPSILLCANGYVLARVARELVALGLSTPGDVDLAGMDDAGPGDILPITAVAATLPSRQIGEEAMRLLHHRIAENEPYRDIQHRVLPTEIRTRDSAPGYLTVTAAEHPA